MTIEQIGIKPRKLEITGIQYDGTNLNEIADFVASSNNANEWIFIPSELKKYDKNGLILLKPTDWVLKLFGDNTFIFSSEQFKQTYYIKD